MRIRPIAALSVAAVSALLLAGCAAGAPESTPSASSSAAGLCASAAPAGPVAESVTVSGEVGAAPTVEFDEPLEIETTERVVVVEGDGDELTDGDYVAYAAHIFDATTGDTLYEGGYEDDAATIPMTVGSGPDTIFGCATEGSRVVVTAPATDQSGTALVYVLDVLDVIPADDWCAVTEPGAAFPTVAFSDTGVPTITVPNDTPPTDVQLQVLEEGDGEVVQSGDNVTVNYTGVKWSDGTEFDSSWTSGQPATFATTGVVTGFQRALEGQTVGSTVLVAMPPACAYGETGDSELAGETLVFVVDIIETARPE